MEPIASSTASETRFSEGISSRPVAWRRASSRSRSAICGSTESSGRFMRSSAGGVDVIRNLVRKPWFCCSRCGMDRTAILSDGVEECQFRLTLCGLSAFLFFDGRDFVEAALVAATQVGGGQENLRHGNGGFAGDDAAAEREHVRIVVFPRQAGGID